MTIFIQISHRDEDADKEWNYRIAITEEAFEFSQAKILDWEFEKAKLLLLKHLKETINDMAVPTVP